MGASACHQRLQLRLCVSKSLVNGLDAVDDIVHFGAEDGVELGPFCDDRTVNAAFKRLAYDFVLRIGLEDLGVLQAGVTARNAALVYGSSAASS